MESEIAELEESLRLAELGPDPQFFREALADNVVLVSEDAQPFQAKQKIVEAGTAAVVTCQGTYEGPGGTTTLKFMRVWLKHNNRWQIIAGSVSH